MQRARRLLSTFSVDRSGLLGTQHAAVEANAATGATRPAPVRQTPLLKFIRDSVSLRGPLSVAEFMKLCLGHPTYGYYMRSPEAIFGQRGDFVTSPEVSTLFGELLAVWTLGTWMSSPSYIPGSPFRLVECGPGRGTLAHDMVKTLRRLSRGPDAAAVQALHLVETSPSCRSAQAAALTCEGGGASGECAVIGAAGPWPGLPVHWHDRFDGVPAGSPLMIVAHELFDALPVHQFVRCASASGGWLERLVDVDPHHAALSSPTLGLAALSSPPLGVAGDAAGRSDDDTRGLRVVVAPGRTPAAAAYGDALSRWFADDSRSVEEGTVVEYSPAGIALAREFAERISADGGAALIIDYCRTLGSSSGTTNSSVSAAAAERVTGSSLRGIADHAFVDPLHAPGETDLSVDVDFAALASAAAGVPGAHVHGPISQTALLVGLGLQQRVERLVAASGEDTRLAERIVADATRLAHPEQMGGVYKALAITRGGDSAVVPPPPAF